jgi:hypothetical protein
MHSRAARETACTQSERRFRWSESAYCSPKVRCESVASNKGVDEMTSGRHSLCVLILAMVLPFCIASCSDSPTRADSQTVQEYEVDANTVLLDHLNNSALGDANNVSYRSSCASLDACCVLDGLQYGSTTYVQYPETDPLSTPDGTLEAWMWIDGDFNEATVASQGPSQGSPSGWTFHLSVVQTDTSGLHVRAHVWSGFILDSNTAVSPKEWTHVAFTWGSRGAELWIDGELDATDASTAHAAPGYGGHLILRTGSQAILRIDEVRLSDVQREQFYSLK